MPDQPLQAESAAHDEPAELDSEDAKLVTLARATRARSGAAEGAAVRDGTGRTYAAATVALASLPLSALRVAVAMAASSGATTLEAAAVVREDDGRSLPESDAAAVRDLGGPGTPVFVASPAGVVLRTVQS
jgi:hypothetical protein